MIINHYQMQVHTFVSQTQRLFLKRYCITYIHNCYLSSFGLILQWFPHKHIFLFFGILLFCSLHLQSKHENNKCIKMVIPEVELRLVSVCVAIVKSGSSLPHYFSVTFAGVNRKQQNCYFNQNKWNKYLQGWDQNFTLKGSLTHIWLFHIFIYQGAGTVLIGALKLYYLQWFWRKRNQTPERMI